MSIVCSAALRGILVLLTCLFYIHFANEWNHFIVLDLWFLIPHLSPRPLALAFNIKLYQ